jgi:hypothetical protein
MPIDPQQSGQSLPSQPTSPGTGALGSSFNTLKYFEDFIYDSTATPTEISGSSGMSFLTPADAAHPGIFQCDLTVASGGFQYVQQGNTQGLNFGIYSAIDLEWLWQLNQAPGGTGFRCVQGFATGNGGAGGTGDAGLVFSTPGTFGGPGTTSNLFVQLNNGAGDVFIDTGVTLASVIGTWVKTNFVWNRATGFLRVSINGTQVVNTNSAALPTTLTNRRPFFAYSNFQAGAISATARMFFDYLKLTLTTAR